MLLEAKRITLSQRWIQSTNLRGKNLKVFQIVDHFFFLCSKNLVKSAIFQIFPNFWRGNFPLFPSASTIILGQKQTLKRLSKTTRAILTHIWWIKFFINYENHIILWGRTVFPDQNDILSFITWKKKKKKAQSQQATGCYI